MATVELVTTIAQNQTVDDEPQAWFDPQAVLLNYYAENPQMQQIVMSYNINAYGNITGYIPTNQFVGQNLEWGCLASSDQGFMSVQEYLFDFAFAYFGSLHGGTLVRPCIGYSGGVYEDDPDMLVALMDFEEVAQPQLVVSIGASDVISALSGASPSEIAQIQTLLSIPPPFSGITAVDIYNAIAEGDESTLIGIDNELGVPTSLQPDEVTDWVQEITTAAPGTWCPALRDILFGDINPLTFEVHIDPLIPNTNIGVSMEVGSCAVVTLEAGADIVNSCICGLYSLALPACGGGSELVTIPEMQLPDPSDPSITYHLGDALQAILNLVSLTAKNKDCCGASVDWVNPQDFAWNVTDTLYSFQGSARAVYVEIVANDNPARIQWQPPEGGLTGGVQRFGKLVFQYADGTQGPVMFLNTNKQIFSVPDNNVTGCEIYLNAGVEASILQSGYPLWPGTTFPLING
jgi:hypothetical protein